MQSRHDSELLGLLYRQVSSMIGALPARRMTVLKMKVWLLPLIYTGLYILALTYAAVPWLYYCLFSLMGFMVVILFTNVIHELCHGNVYKNPRLNRLGYYLFDYVGANSYIWQQRHLVLHHRFPNVSGWDPDVEQKGPVAVFPGEPVRRMHRFQYLYIFLLYPLFMLNWLLVRDFKDFFSSSRIVRRAVNIPGLEYVKLFLFKGGYLIMILVLPVLLTGISWGQSFLGLLALTVSGSLLAMFVLLTPHINTGNVFPEVNARGIIPLTWLRHQFISVNDIDNTNWFIRNVMGNFNLHLAHHLLPRFSCVYTPEITAVVKAFAEEHGFPYRSYPLSVSFRKHSQLIRDNAERAAVPEPQTS
jgi:linoleoyl-CoA desaturase